MAPPAVVNTAGAAPGLLGSSLAPEQRSLVDTMPSAHLDAHGSARHVSTRGMTRVLLAFEIKKRILSCSAGYLCAGGGDSMIRPAGPCD